VCALSLDKQGCGNCAKDKSSQDSKNYSSNGSRPNTTLAGGSRRTVATEATQDLLSMIRAFAKEQKVPIMDDTQMQWWQDAKQLLRRHMYAALCTGCTTLAGKFHDAAMSTQQCTMLSVQCSV